MTMSVADNPIPETTPEPTQPNLQQQLAVGSAIGALALLAGLGFIFGGLPTLWFEGWSALFTDYKEMQENVFLSDALLILVELVVIGGLAYGAYLGLQNQKQPGLRAGIVFLAAFTLGVLSFTFWIGDKLNIEEPGVGWAVFIGIIAVCLGGAGYVYAMVPGWVAFLEAVEHQGWFHAYAYKGNQGVRVRRGTIAGVLAVGVTGIITMVTHNYFGRERFNDQGAVIANDWYWTIMYSEPEKIIPLMFKVHLLMPIVLGVLLMWVAWRVVNIPAFADFLIATEAEMNKVSWTTRKRLGQDTDRKSK